MDELAKNLKALIAANHVLDADIVIGREIQKLFVLLKTNEPVPADFEDILLSLISANLNMNNAHFIALCCVLYYRRQKPVNYWKLMPLLTDKIRKFHVPAIVVLGVMSRRLCEGFKSQLHAPVSILLSANEELMPLVCQCFRRIVKGTGTFLIDSIPDIFGFFLCGVSSTNVALMIESVKSLPTLLEHAGVSIKRLLPITEQLLPAQSKVLRFAVAKSLAKLLFIEAKQSKDYCDNPFGFSMPILFRLAQTERNIPTLATAFVILARFYEPIYVMKSLRTFAKFAFSISGIAANVRLLLVFCDAVFRGAVLVAGTTAGSPLCRHLLDLMPENLSPAQAIVAMHLFSEYDCSHKTLALAAKRLYPFLGSNRKDVRRACVSFFARISERDSRLSAIFIETFLSYLSREDASSADVKGFAKAEACLLVSIDRFKQKVVDGVRSLILSWLSEKTELSSPQVPAAFLLAAALMKRGTCGELIPKCFNYVQRIIRERALDASTIRKLAKPVCLYAIVTLQTVHNGVDRLLPTIKAFVNLVLPSTPHLSKTSISILWKLVRSVPRDVRIADEMVKNTLIFVDIMSQRGIEVSADFSEEVDLANV